MAVSEPIPMTPDVVAELVGSLDAVGHWLTTEGDVGSVLPSEEAAITNASAGRRVEFAAGRACARAGFVTLGHRPSAVPRGDDRRPLWPPNLEGSISHTDGIAMALVARRSELNGGGLGIDVERRGRVRRELYRKLFTEAEQIELDGLAADDEAKEATARFSGKEAFYKAQYSFTRSWVSFTDVTTVRNDSGQLMAHPATDLDALSLVSWPVKIGVVNEDDRVTTGVFVEPAGRN